ncbi:nuclear transport factor 2 family protein [Pseudomonas sp. RIT-PI-S]|uniref:nuclear transport factor 2 family protein n=1 Tax=Pseudomonas sp. RIT-PI-S TaxID=3035295 RepID=UPI0021DA7E7C|nr:nuclear transport factor 2 family protein [Pseudomonas sp. RIT-PI-S]
MELADLKAIEALFSEFAWCADRGLGEKMAALFAEDGVLAIGELEFQGHGRIGLVCQQRAQPPRYTRHTWSGLRVAEDAGDWVRTTAIQTTFERSDTNSSPLVRVSDLFDQLIKTEAGIWRFVRREISRQLSVGA